MISVHSSDGAEAIARKNGLTVADMLRPFMEVKQQEFPFRMVSSGTFTMKGFNVRLIPAEELQCPTPEMMEFSLWNAVKEASSQCSKDISPTLSTALSTVESSIDWISRQIGVSKGNLPPGEQGLIHGPKWYGAFRKQQSVRLSWSISYSNKIHLA